MSPTESLDPHKRTPYRRRARPVVFAAVLFANAGVGGLVKPSTIDNSAAASALGDAAQTVWLGLFAVGGVLAVAGVYWRGCPRPEVEAAGLWPLIAGCAVYLLTILLAHGTITVVPILALAIWTLHGRLLDLYDARDVAADRRLLAERFAGPERRTHGAEHGAPTDEPPPPAPADEDPR